jgi:hypothetical protein
MFLIETDNVRDSVDQVSKSWVRQFPPLVMHGHTNILASTYVCLLYATSAGKRDEIANFADKARDALRHQVSVAYPGVSVLVLRLKPTDKRMTCALRLEQLMGIQGRNWLLLPN